MTNIETVVNGRALDGALTGVQRYSHEVLSRLASPPPTIHPQRVMAGPLGHLWEQVELPRLVGKQLLWSPANTGPLAVARQVVTIHDAAPLDEPKWFDRRFAQWYQFLWPRLMRRVRFVLTVSAFSRARLVHHVPEAAHKVIVTPLGVDGRFFAPYQEEGIRMRYALPERYILSLGSLEPRKNLGRLFAAWHAWNDRPNDLKLVVVGGAGKVFSSVGFDKLPAGVELLGRVDDAELPALYSKAMAFVFPSLYEGFGLPPLEAMASGTPVVCSTAASLPEVTAEACLGIDPLETTSILAGLRRISRDHVLREELSAAGRERARRFDWSTTAELTQQVLDAAVR